MNSNNRSVMIRFVAFFLILFFTPLHSFAQGKIVDFRTADRHNYTRFVLETDQSVDYQLMTLSNPERLVIDVKNSSWNVIYKNQHLSLGKHISLLRQNKRNSKDVRIVLDLKQKVKLLKPFVIEPSSHPNHRLVVDFVPMQAVSQPPSSTTQPTFSQANNQAAIMSNGKIVTPPISLSPAPKAKPLDDPNHVVTKKPLVIIDAGHGGHDPGAIGRAGTYEKTITLSYGLALSKALEKTGRFRTYLTRDKDFYIPLKKRVKKAHSAEGDIFISLHADSHPNKKIGGLSVYTLSETASDKEAAALARKENKESDLGGLDINDESDDVASVLIGMVQRETKNNSARFAELLTDSLKGKVNLLPNTHRYAGFRVLTSAAIPSVLIELGYLSNRKEEKNLKSRSYQKRVVKGLVEGISRYFGRL